MQKARADFRSRHGFTNEQYLTVLAPGETNHAIDFSFKSFAGGLKKFAETDNVKTVDKSFFKTLIILPENQVQLFLFRLLPRKLKQKLDQLPDSSMSLLLSRVRNMVLSVPPISQFCTMEKSLLKPPPVSCQLW